MALGVDDGATCDNSEQRFLSNCMYPIYRGNLITVHHRRHHLMVIITIMHYSYRTSLSYVL